MAGARTERMFVAVDVPESIRIRAVDTASQLSRSARVVPAGNIHITLAFLGDTEVDSIDGICAALGRVTFRSFRVELRGFGTFSSWPRVVFAMVTEGKDGLAVLHEGVMRALAPFAASMRLDSGSGFVPHITVARIRHLDRHTAGEAMAFVDAHRDDGLGGFECIGFKLKRSVLAREGAAYSDVCAFSAKD
jgi:2'-5' RNA ligase